MAVSKFIVCRDDSIYQAFPDVVMTDKGKLICIFTQCKHHGDRENSHLVLCESTDRGRTWSERKRLTPPKPMSEGFWNCARISKEPDGSLVILCDLVHNNGTERGIIYMWNGDPEGNSFDGPYKTPAIGIVPDKYLVLENGRHIISAQHNGEETGKLEQYLWYSDDEGKTWSERIIVAKDVRYQLCEGTILPMKDGTLVCFMRENSFLGYDCLKTISYDSGESWSKVINVPIPGCHRPVSGYLHSGNVLITYRFMQGGKGWLGSWTQNFFCALTNEESCKATERNEQMVRIMPLDFDRSPVSDLGYSGWVQFDDGEIYVVNYIADDAPCPYIRGYSFYESDMILK